MFNTQQQQSGGADLALQAIENGSSLVKLENQTQMLVAIQKPRDEKKILQSCLQELEIYPSAAEEAIYNKPVGKIDGVMQFSEGLSIRAAESLAGRWCNSSYGCEIIAETQDSVTLGAVFLDMEHNTRHSLTRRVAKGIRKRDGSFMKFTGDRLDTHIQAQQSKLLREVILRSLPSGLKKEYEYKAKQVIGGGAANGSLNLAKMYQAWSTYNVTKHDLQLFLGYDPDKITPVDHQKLVGLFNAIRAGEISADETFADVRAKQNISDTIKSNGYTHKTSQKQQPKKPEPVNSEGFDEESERQDLLDEINEIIGKKELRKGDITRICAMTIGAPTSDIQSLSLDQLVQLRGAL